MIRLRVSITRTFPPYQTGNGRLYVIHAINDIPPKSLNGVIVSSG